jgi:biotin carboxyl carrier protein
MISIDVQPGDRVTTGQPVAVIESMKMEQTIASPRDGTVRAVTVEPGDTVAYGQTLIEFEPQ